MNAQHIEECLLYHERFLRPMEERTGQIQRPILLFSDGKNFSPQWYGCGDGTGWLLVGQLPVD